MSCNFRRKRASASGNYGSSMQETTIAGVPSVRLHRQRLREVSLRRVPSIGFCRLVDLEIQSSSVIKELVLTLSSLTHCVSCKSSNVSRVVDGKSCEEPSDGFTMSLDLVVDSRSIQKIHMNLSSQWLIFMNLLGQHETLLFS